MINPSLPSLVQKPRVRLLKKYLCLLPLTSALAVASLANVYAQSALNRNFQTLISFGIQQNHGAARPMGKMIRGSDGLLYGVTYATGSYDEHGGNGGIYKVTTPRLKSQDQPQVTTVHRFSDMGNNEPGGPSTGLIFGADGYLYGTTISGGDFGGGTIYKIATDGTAFSIVHSFNRPDGSDPEGELLLAPDGNFYGTTQSGGANNSGTVFKLTPAGIHTILYNFDISDPNSGSGPTGQLALGNDGNFYGSAFGGGVYGHGIAFKVSPTGSFTLLHAFGDNYMNGLAPVGGLILANDGRFYGVCEIGGNANASNSTFGLIYSVTASGGYQIVYKFLGDVGGQTPYGRLVYNGGFLYGVTSGGGEPSSGSYPAGTVFAYDLLNNILTQLHTFHGSLAGADTEGTSPYAPLLLDGGFLYGVTESGGYNGGGTLFRLSSTVYPK